MRRRQGLTLLEVVISTIIITVLAAAMIPALNSYNSQKTVAAAAVILDSIARATVAFDRSAVARHPGAVIDLVDPIASTSSTSCNGSNGGTISTYGGQAGSWVGPYFNRSFNPTTGLDIGIGVVRNTMRRTSANNVMGTLNVFIDRISYADVMALNDLLDGYNEGATTSSAMGFLRWTYSSTGIVSAAYIVIGVDNSC